MKMVQVRNVPDPLHRELKARAARAGMSLSDYLLRELEAIASRPTREEILARIAARSPVEEPLGVAEALRDEREGR